MESGKFSRMPSTNPSWIEEKGGYIVEVDDLEQLQKVLQQTTDEGQGGCLHIRLDFYRQSHEGIAGDFYLAC